MRTFQPVARVDEAPALTGTIDRLSAALTANTAVPDLRAKREAAYWRALSEDYVGFVRLLGGAVTVIFSFGAILGALNTMYRKSPRAPARLAPSAPSASSPAPS